MKALFALFGRALFWILWPALYVYMRGSSRTRVLIMCGDEALVIKHWLGRNFWQIPGGGLHADEPLARGAVREVREETGIHLEESAMKYLGSFASRGNGIPITLKYFYVQLPEKPQVIIQPQEVRQYRWLSVATAKPEELKNLAPLLALASK